MPRGPNGLPTGARSGQARAIGQRGNGALKARKVPGPAMPSGVRWAQRWNLIKARLTWPPKPPSIAAFGKPCHASANWSSATSQPVIPGARTRDPSTCRAKRPKAFADTDALYPEIQRLRYKLELIGGIDPEIVKEYQDTNARFEFLDGQVKDLQGAIEGTEKIVDELDEQIRDQSEKAFRSINEEFQKYFKVLFGGGS